VALSVVKKSTRLPDLCSIPAVDEVGVNERVARFQSRSVKKEAKVEALVGHDINIASVATAFPSGMSILKVKLDDTRMAVKAGATEIDMVISRGKFLAGDC